jgi:hypothetical protein
MQNEFSRRGLIFLGVPLLAQVMPEVDPKLAHEMVGVSHSNLKRVQELVEKDPGLARACIDWGYGDWETAIGAASHVGNREIAEFLLAHGAVPTIFSAAMLGQLEVVKGMVAAMPGIQRTYGPHGIPLLFHASAGGEKAKAVFEYLTSLGDAGKPQETQPLSVEQRDTLPGKYVFGEGAQEHFVVDVVKDRLGINRPGAPSRVLLHHAGGLVFYPSGSPWTKIAFQLQSGRVTGLQLGSLKAKRV